MARVPAAKTVDQGEAGFGGWICTVNAEANTAHYKAEAERIRVACVAERLIVEAGNPAPLLVADKPLLATTSESIGMCWTFKGYS